MTPTPPPRVRWANLAMTLGLIVFAIGVVFFIGVAARGRQLHAGGPGTVRASPHADTVATSRPRPPTATPDRRPRRRRRRRSSSSSARSSSSGWPAPRRRRRCWHGRRRARSAASCCSASRSRARASSRAAIKYAPGGGGGGRPAAAADRHRPGGRRHPRLPVGPAGGVGVPDGPDGPDEVESLGAATGLALATLGVNVDLAPVADVAGRQPSFMRDTLRTFSSIPRSVAW